MTMHKSTPPLRGIGLGAGITGIAALAVVGTIAVQRIGWTNLQVVGRIVNMRLDPTEQDQIEDRRGERSARPGDLSRLGPPPWAQGGGYRPPETSGSASQSRRPARWRYCDGPPGKPHRRCTAWREGPDPYDHENGGPPDQRPQGWGRP